MKHRIFQLTQFVFAVTACAAEVGACQLIDGEHIRAGDLAAAAPAFASLDPELEIGLAPLPGIKRVLHSADLRQLARDHGIEFFSAPADVCFERSGSAASRTARAMTPVPPAVRRGDKVAVSVTTGSVLLTFETEAESSGRVGDTVIVRNPANGNRFVAQVQDQGKVMVKK